MGGNQAAVELLIQLRDEASKGMDGLGDKVGGLASMLGPAALGGALLGVGASAFSMASDVKQATNDIQASLGLTKEEAQSLSDSAVNIFGNNWGASVDDVTQSLITVKQQMQSIGEGDLEGATQAALALRDTFGIEVTESTNAANTLMKQFGLTSQEAFDFIVAGNQKGLNASGDFLDTIGEYSTQFSSGGASADEFFSLLQNGMQGGMLGTDKAADAFKEFRVRIQDGSSLTSDSLKMIGIDAKALAKGMADGSITAADAFQMVNEKLAAVDDKNIQMQAGVGLLGTQFEDLGTKGALGLSMVGTNMEDIAGATDSLNTKYNNFGSFFEGVWRKAQVALLPVGDGLLNLANGALPIVEGALTNVVNFVSQNAIPVGSALAGVLAAVVIPAFVGWATTMLTVTLPALLATMAPVLAAAAPFIALGLTVGALWMAFDSNFLGIRDIVTNAWAAMQPVIQAMQDGWTGFVQVVVDAWAGFMAIIQPQIDNVMALVSGVATAFQTFFGTIGGGGDIMAALGTLFADLGTKVGEFVMATLQWLANAVPQIVGALAGWAGAFLGWIGSDVLPFIGEKLMDLGTAIWNWITGGGLEALVNNLATWGGAILNFIAKDVLPFLGQKLLDLGNFIWTWMTNGGLMGLIDNLVKWGGAFLNWIAKDVLPFIGQKLGELATFLWNWITNDALPTIISKLGEWGGAFLNWVTKDVLPFLGTKLAEIATAIWNWITQTASTMVTNLKALATSFWTWITDTVKALPGKLGEIASGIWTWITETARTALTKAADMGRNIIDGILNGLKNAAGAVWDWLTGFLGGMLDNVKNFFGIESPSKVMRDQVGVPIMQGIQVGMEEAAPALVAAAKGLLGDLVGGMKTEYLAQVADQNIIGNDAVSQELLRQSRTAWAGLREASKQDINELMASDKDAYLQALKDSPVIGDAAGAEMIEQSRKAWAGLRAADGKEIETTAASLIDGAESFFRSYFGGVASFYQQALAILVSQTEDGIANILAAIARMNGVSSNGVPVGDDGIPDYQQTPGSHGDPNANTGGGGSGRGMIPLADGFDGWVTRPTHFLVGEAGPEYMSVMPKGKGSRGGGNVNINLTVNAGLGADGESIASSVITTLRELLEQDRSMSNAYGNA